MDDLVPSLHVKEDGEGPAAAPVDWTPARVIRVLVYSANQGRDGGRLGPRTWPFITWRCTEKIPKLLGSVGIRHPDDLFNPYGALENRYFLLDGGRHVAYWKWVEWTQEALGRKIDLNDHDRPIFALRPDSYEPMTQRWFAAIRHSPLDYAGLMQTTKFYLDQPAVAESVRWAVVYRALRTGDLTQLAAPERKVRDRPGPMARPLELPEGLDKAWAELEARYGIGSVATHKGRIRKVLDYLKREGKGLPATPSEVVEACRSAAVDTGYSRPDLILSSWRAFARSAAAVGIPLPIPPNRVL